MHQGPLSLGPKQAAYLSYEGGGEDMLAPVDFSLMVANGHGPNAPPVSTATASIPKGFG